MMFKTAVICVSVLALSACGGSRYASQNARSVAPAPSPVIVSSGDVAVQPVALPFARGPIQKACINSDRKARSRARCGCVQAVADQSLSGADQRRGAKYWKNPGKLQEVRQSDNPSNERFWKAWKAFGQSAAAQCRNS